MIEYVHRLSYSLSAQLRTSTATRLILFYTAQLDEYFDVENARIGRVVVELQKNSLRIWVAKD